MPKAISDASTNNNVPMDTINPVATSASSSASRQKRSENTVKVNSNDREPPEAVQWYPGFGPVSPKVTFISKDKQTFMVDKERLVKQSVVFKSMLSPSMSMNIDVEGQEQTPIEVDESAKDLGAFFSCLGVGIRLAIELPDDLEDAQDILRLAEKYQAHDLICSTEEKVESIIAEDPFAIFIHASKTDDIELARRAIKHIEFDPYGGTDIWEEMFELPPSWQIAFARLVTPKLTYEDGHVDTEPYRVSMSWVARKFNPE